MSKTSLVDKTKSSAEADLVEDNSKELPNQANIMTLIALKQFYKDANEETDAINAAAREENKYLIQAMQMLTGTGRYSKDESTRKKLENKFGTGMDGAISLSGFLKSKINEKEVDALLTNAYKHVGDNKIRNKRSAIKDKRGSAVVGKKTGSNPLADPEGADVDLEDL